MDLMRKSEQQFLAQSLRSSYSSILDWLRKLALSLHIYALHNVYVVDQLITVLDVETVIEHYSAAQRLCRGGSHYWIGSGNQHTL